jgi:hypothetical protein
MNLFFHSIKKPVIYSVVTNYLFVLCIISLPYNHNILADLAGPLTKSISILYGMHHHEANLKYPVFDFHIEKKYDITPCILCGLSSNFVSHSVVLIKFAPNNHCVYSISDSITFSLPPTVHLLPENRPPPVFTSIIYLS